MTSLRVSPAFRAAVAVAGVVILTWSIGGQFALWRIDPALALPLMPLPALWLAWLLRDEARSARRRTMALALALLVITQALLALALSARSPWLQLGLGAFCWLLALAAAESILRWHRRKVVTLLIATLVVAGWFVGGHWLLATLYRPVAASGPPVTMLTGLPLRWSEGTDLSAILARGASEDPALVRIEAAGPVRLVDSLIDSPPPSGGSLLLAHPRALAPRELVAIDAFVRGGARAVVLADALSGWPMRHPIGDPRNPPVTSLLTPLLDHWGVTLGAASVADRRTVPVDIAGARLRLFTVGRFERLPPACEAYADRRVARCRIGRGELWLVGDADLLFAPLWQPAPRWAAHLRQADTMEWLAVHLWPKAPRALLQPLWIRVAAQ